jgi:hypothetical protein
LAVPLQGKSHSTPSSPSPSNQAEEDEDEEESETAADDMMAIGTSPRALGTLSLES